MLPHTDIGPLELVIGPDDIHKPILNGLMDQPSVVSAAHRLALERALKQFFPTSEFGEDGARLVRELLRKTPPTVLEDILKEFPDFDFTHQTTDEEISLVLQSRVAHTALQLARKALTESGFSTEGDQHFMTSLPITPRSRDGYGYTGVEYIVQVGIGEVSRPKENPINSLVSQMKLRIDDAFAEGGTKSHIDAVSATISDFQGETGRFETAVVVAQDRSESRPAKSLVKCTVEASAGFRVLLEEALGPDVTIRIL